MSMTAYSFPGAGQTMSSREIAELTGKEHDNVRRDIQKLATDLSLTFEEMTQPSTGGRPSLNLGASAPRGVASGTSALSRTCWRGSAPRRNAVSASAKENAATMINERG